MVFKASVSVVFFSLSFRLLAQNGDFSVGARGAGMSYSIVALSDHWNIFYNPAGIRQDSGTHIFISYENRYLLEDFQVVAAGVVQNFKKHSHGISFYKFGKTLYNEQKIGYTASHAVGFITFGVTLNYLQYHIENINTRGFFTMEAGMRAEMGKKFFLGAYIHNVTQTLLNKVTGERIPTLMRVGFSYFPIPSFVFSAELEKNLSYPLKWKAGMEYKIRPFFVVRTGIITFPFMYTFGTGFAFKKILLDIAYKRNTIMGNSFLFSLSYTFFWR